MCFSPRQGCRLLFCSPLGMGPKKDQNGDYALTIPLGAKKLPTISSEDIGKCALGIFKKGKEFIGKTVGIAGEHLSGDEMAAAFSRALGKTVRYVAVEPAVYRSFGFPGADDLGNMFQFNRDFDDAFRKPRNIEFARSINPNLQTFDTWLAKNKTRIPID